VKLTAEARQLENWRDYLRISLFYPDLVSTQALGKKLTQRTRSTHEGHQENEFSTKKIVIFIIPVNLFRAQAPLSYTSGSANGI
jgi:hypothetical protein